jgi:Tfp pilus assembly protein PilF
VAYKRAYAMLPDDAVVNYNLGLLFAERKDYAQALPLAEKAYSLGFPLPGLKNKLVAAGQWPAEQK